MLGLAVQAGHRGGALVHAGIMIGTPAGAEEGERGPAVTSESSAGDEEDD
ncbi:MAG TPA: hypothetical protein VMH40_02420 [Myxococcaceae bacterium]|nr:hypothetical protein [Myxococcaceae bacterium]